MIEEGVTKSEIAESDSQKQVLDSIDESLKEDEASRSEAKKRKLFF